MIIIDKTIVSDDLLKKRFVCDLNACKGACCVAGDSGAPLDEEETAILEDIYEDVKPYMTAAGIEAVAEYGNYVMDADGDLVTPLIKGKECAYTFFEEDGTAKCAIEKAFYEGKTNFLKPVSCHLYPVRITRYSSYDAVNYHEWDVCEPACACGGKLDVKVYKFLQKPLIRKYGEEWFRQLEIADKELS